MFSPSNICPYIRVKLCEPGKIIILCETVNDFQHAYADLDMLFSRNIACKMLGLVGEKTAATYNLVICSLKYHRIITRPLGTNEAREV